MLLQVTSHILCCYKSLVTHCVVTESLVAYHHIKAKPVTRDGEIYWDLQKYEIDMSTKHMTLLFRNLFNGDKTLGKWAQASSPRLHICMVRSSPQKSYCSSGGHATLRPLGFLAIKRTLLWDTCQLSDGYHHVEGSDYAHCHPHILNTDSAASFKTLGVIIQKIRIFMVTTVRQSNSLLIYWGSHFVPAHTPISYLHCTFFPLVNRGLVRVLSLLQKVYMLADHSKKPICYRQLCDAGKGSPILDFKLSPCSECCMLSSG